MVYALDSTTIDLYLSLFPRAKFRKTKGDVKMHTVLDLRGSIPIHVGITNAEFTRNRNSLSPGQGTISTL